MQNGTTTLENSLTVSHEAKHNLTIWFRNCTPRYLPKLVENLCPHKNLHTNILAALFIIAKNWKQSRCPSIEECMNCDRPIQ